MAAQRNYVQDQMQPAARLPRLAGDHDLGGMNPALSSQRRQLETLLTDEEPQVQPYNGALRLAIILGSSGAMWAIVAAGAWRLLSAR